MKKLLMVLLAVSFFWVSSNTYAGWHESFTKAAVPDSSGKITSDHTWQWWGWGKAVVKDGALELTGAKDPFGTFTCWIQIDPSLDPSITITPTDCEMYFKIKITTTGTQSTSDQFHVPYAIDPNFMQNLNVFTVFSMPLQHVVGVLYFATDSIMTVNANAAIGYDQYYWEKIKVKDGQVSAWVYPDGGAPGASPDVQFTQTKVTTPAPMLALIGSFASDSAKVYIDEIYYNETPSVVGVSENPAPIAVDYSLQQNYPNPFNPETSIRYSLKEQSRVILKIYNLKGETVATLVDGVVSAGLHDVNWNAANMPSGVYLYKLKTAKFSQTKKMLLVK
ncbi:hypothetical protein BMS3Abin05_01969 [bacterium BMS3Abin05]|nr:hypothetical protein BMS3Abin05_01969 [bacterium BMS3Abin05]GBE27392.1 hypothetical protein BMS3Bbin03_01317 [bacterium BMS3Bbin03]